MTKGNNEDFQKRVRVVVVGGATSDALKSRIAGDYDSLRDSLIIRYVNYELRKDQLDGCVYERFSDMAKVLYQRIDDKDGTLTTCKIDKDEVRLWGMEGEEERIMEAALRNTMRLYPASIFNHTIMKEVDVLDSSFCREDILMPMTGSGLLTTFRITNGAAAIFYPGVREKLAGVMGGSFLAVFMNINDIMIFDKESDLAEKYLMIAGKSTDLGEKLSERVYLCTGKGIVPVTGENQTRKG